MAKNKTNTAPSTTPRGQRAPKGVLWRLLKTLFEFYPVLLPITLVCILINAIVSSVPSVFMQNIIALVDSSYKSGDWSSVSGQILTFVGILITMYIISLIAGFCYTQLYDVEQEVNGLYTYGRKEKFDIQIIREINQQKAAIEE